MVKEIEIKILDINVDEIQRKLSKIGAAFRGEELQRIYTYDVQPISTNFLSIIEVLRNPDMGRKEKKRARLQLSALLQDLIDLLSKSDLVALLRAAKVKSVSGLLRKLNARKALPQEIFSDEVRRIVNRYHTNPNKWVRVRSTAGGASIALKQIYGRKIIRGIRQHSIDAVKEVEIGVDSFETAKMLLEELGYFPKNYQEKKRISYALGKFVKIDIDFWPHIPAFLEVEAKTRRQVYATLSKLDIRSTDAVIMNADDVYSFYGLDMYSYDELRF